MSTSEKSIYRLAAKLFSLAAAALLSYFAMLYFCNHFDRYLDGYRPKMELLRTTASPRLVLLGGSNLAFGIDSPRLEQALGMPVVNTGFHAGLGLKYMLDSARPLLRKGDVVLVVPEYDQFTGDNFYGDDSLLNLFLVTRDIDILKRLKPQMILTANYTIFRFKPMKLFGECPARFNRYGDEIAHLGKPNGDFSHVLPFDKDLNYRAIDYLHTFMGECEARGIKTLFEFPCLSRTAYNFNHARIDEIETALKRTVSCAAPAHPLDFVYDDGLFFDSIYHLNAEGRRVRTDKLISLTGGLLRRSSTERVEPAPPKVEGKPDFRKGT